MKLAENPTARLSPCDPAAGVHVQLDLVGWCAKRQVEADFVPPH
jgi:hypothetical protein